MKIKVGDIVVVKYHLNDHLMVVSHLVGDRVACGTRREWGWLYAQKDLKVIKDVAAFMRTGKPPKKK